MRKLLYVPILHLSADLGSIAADATRRGKALVGEQAWQRHRDTVTAFWDRLKIFFQGIPAEGLKIYQDGMLARGEAGRKIVEEAAQKGSWNYRLVQDLCERGAELMLTEDYQLAKKERDLLVALSKSEGLAKRVGAYLKYRFLKGLLLKKRDRFIAERIDKTLGENETGVLFLGASHAIQTWLPRDIEVIALKNREKIMGYQKSVLRTALVGNRGAAILKELSEYLTAPIRVTLTNAGVPRVESQAE